MLATLLTKKGVRVPLRNQFGGGIPDSSGANLFDWLLRAKQYFRLHHSESAGMPRSPKKCGIQWVIGHFP